ncbi:MAG TPA: PTS sugar transporter subunit IIA [Spirochaetota bacterium]|nr:PTS sugar transporter subunit IIA [Spirochaetota bacterium]HPF05394.1 PTS sugar transporter subunit IIA [Spirochaetota bacterium]HPJ42351.1 PTS sugar transporter subunit IIA [Spirochaetota bacterium]HPR36120.1 PTS sugar transporter subunit IIA [Spirochaetota bacterium]HRX47792.1 PTS sugar transporter subunit IIA [Spirochaetota bacterium]
MKLDNFFTKEQVVKINAAEKQPALKELISELQNQSLIENSSRYYAQVAHRESLENTGIGNALAIPHARTDSVDKFITILGIADTPVEYQSIDEKPVKYILLSIFPTSMSTKYLYLIGMMARIFNNKENNTFFAGNPTPSELFKFLDKECESYYKSISDESKKTISGNRELTGVPSSDLDLMIRLDRLYNSYHEQGKPESIKQKIDDLKKLIDNRSLTYYERMKKKNNNPFSIVEKNSCSGCHMNIPPVELKEIQDRENIHICTYCGRFLIML